METTLNPDHGTRATSSGDTLVGASEVDSVSVNLPIVCDTDNGAFQNELDRQLTLPGADGFSIQSNNREEGSSLVAGDYVDGQPEVPQQWDPDISRGHQKTTVAEQLSMVLPAVTRIVAGFAGGTVATVGYAAGKIGETVGVQKAVDSKTFRAGFTSWMWSNGIFPWTNYEPLGARGDDMAKLYELPSVPTAEDMSLTPLILSNHICYLDGMILASVFGAPKIVAMASSRNTPVLGKLMEEMEVIFVDRADKDSRHATLDAISNHCKEWKPGGRPLVIFPEGTTTNGEGLLPFKKGSFISGVPVRPVLIVYTGQWDPASVTYRMTDEGPVELSDAEWAKQFMGHFVHSLHVRVLPPYIPDEAEKLDADLYARNVHAIMEPELARLRKELLETSWKAAAGREDGGLGYQIGDIFRWAVRQLPTGPMPLLCGGRRQK